MRVQCSATVLRQLDIDSANTNRQLVKKCAVKGSGLQRVKLPRGRQKPDPSPPGSYSRCTCSRPHSSSPLQTNASMRSEGKLPRRDSKSPEDITIDIHAARRKDYDLTYKSESDITESDYERAFRSIPTSLACRASCLARRCKRGATQLRNEGEDLP